MADENKNTDCDKKTMKTRRQEDHLCSPPSGMRCRGYSQAHLTRIGLSVVVAKLTEASRKRRFSKIIHPSLRLFSYYIMAIASVASNLTNSINRFLDIFCRVRIFSIERHFSERLSHPVWSEWNCKQGGIALGSEEHLPL